MEDTRQTVNIRIYFFLISKSKEWRPEMSVWACKLWFKTRRASITPNGKVMPRAKGELFFCKHHLQFLLTQSQFWFAFNHACWHFTYLMWALQDRSREEKKSKERSRGKSANPLTGFRCFCCHEWPVGSIKAACCDMANLRPQAAQELESEGSHDTAATDEASAPGVIFN